MIKTFKRKLTKEQLTIEEINEIENKINIEEYKKAQKHKHNLIKWRKRFGRISIVAGLSVLIIGLTLSGGSIIIPIIGGYLIVNGLINIKIS